ncbi:MAG TPA: hypothetical protein DCS93_13710 [Microscillaceae bacterium]|nr:hypothetical protein [Microscillaceae bacterium]
MKTVTQNFATKSLIVSLIQFTLNADQTAYFFEKYNLNSDSGDNSNDEPIDVAVLTQIWQELLDISQNSFLGWECGASFNLLSFGLAGHIVLHSPNIGASIKKMHRYIHLLSDLILYDVQEDQDVTTIVFNAAPAWHQQSENVTQQVIERMMSSMIRGIEYLSGQPFTPQHIFLKRTHPSETPLCWKHLQSVMDFNAEQNAFIFNSEILALPVVHQNTQLLQVLEHHAKQILEESHPQGYVNKTRQKLIAFYEKHQRFCQMEWIAEELNLSQRTLHRKLKAEQYSFSDLVEEVKLSFSKKYLGDTKLSIADIAFLLGYNEISAFYRFFKKHTSITPKSFRESL